MSKKSNKNVIYFEKGVEIGRHVCYNGIKLLFERSTPVMKRITSFLLAIVLFAGLVLTGAPVVHAASDMRVSDELIGILKKEEGFSAKPYWDYNQYTVGYGTRCPDDMLEEYKKNGISEKEAETLLRNYLTGTESTINKKFIDKYNLKLTQGQFDALVTFTYNVGSSWIYDTTGTFHNAVKKGATGSDLINAFTLWCNAGGSILPGLVRRRQCEANMFLNGKYSITRPDHYGYVYYNANGGTVKYKIQGYDANEGVAPAYKPTYSGHTFLGWYTSKTGGEKVTKLTKSHSGDTLYARWDGADEKVETVPAEGITVQVTGSDVNLRKGPGTNYSIVGTAQKGDEMVITETASGSGYEWGNADGKWIALKYTNYDEAVKEQEKVPEETTEPTETTAPSESTETTETTVPDTTVPETTQPEETKVTGTVKANGGLAVREGPGTGYAVIRYLSNGSKVTVTEQKKVGSMTWGKTSDGWISMSYVVLDKMETEPEATVPETTVPETTVPEVTVPETTVPETTVPEVTVPETTVPETTVPETTVPETTPTETTKLTGKVKATGGLAVRKGAGTNYGVVKYLKNGAKVTITEQKTVGSTTWGKISSGWISMRYVVLDESETKPETTVPETTVPDTTAPETTESEQTKLTGKVKATGGLAVRKGAGTSYAVKKYLKNGAKVTITEVKEVKGTKWGKISDGWISMDYVVLDGQKDESSSTTKTVTADCLNVRKSASTSAKIVGYYYEGARVTILETKKVDGTTWGKTSKGWISMKYVK